MDEQVQECSGCGRMYPIRFDEDCPFCYVQQFLEVEAEDDVCPICHREEPIDLGEERREFFAYYDAAKTTPYKEEYGDD